MFNRKSSSRSDVGTTHRSLDRVNSIGKYVQQTHGECGVNTRIGDCPMTSTDKNRQNSLLFIVAPEFVALCQRNYQGHGTYAKHFAMARAK